MKVERVDVPGLLPTAWREAMATWVNQLGEPLATSLPAGHRLFVLTQEDRLLACARLIPPMSVVPVTAGLPMDTGDGPAGSMSGDALRFHFHVGKLVHLSEELRLFSPQQILLLGNDLCDAAEITDLAVDPQASEGELKLRQVLTAIVKSHDGQGRLFVDLQGHRDAQGLSPFWRGLGARFLPEQGDAPGSGPQWRRGFAELLPALPLYASLMDDASRASIGGFGPAARLAREALQAAGFRPGAHVKIDDAGPTWQL
ncbi:arginine N-succinyltransferase [Roseateles sp. So40a]|uniref:arginine N-succinyltransferase n=1 Tax=Roseateles sp. So40a TaxID=3400226 RepID=UPI003A853326